MHPLVGIRVTMTPNEATKPLLVILMASGALNALCGWDGHVVLFWDVILLECVLFFPAGLAFWLCSIKSTVIANVGVVLVVTVRVCLAPLAHRFI